MQEGECRQDQMQKRGAKVVRRSSCKRQLSGGIASHDAQMQERIRRVDTFLAMS